jgi:hypothetical protein
MAFETAAWWAFLCAVSALNVLAWTVSGLALRRPQGCGPPDDRPGAKLQWLLSGGYVFGCAFRSAFPVYDVQRQVLVDTWLSSVMVGRSVATVAELCFVIQWAMLLHAVSKAQGHDFGRAVARIIVPMIVVAEVCSWHAVLTTANLGHVIEESLWGLSSALVVLAIIGLWPRCHRALRPLLLLWGAAGLAYVIYMFGIDVPMYWARWQADEAHGRVYLSVFQGVVDASQRWVVTHRWEDWKSEVVWMSLYFSVAVWLSIGLVHAAAALRHTGSVVHIKPS